MSVALLSSVVTELKPPPIPIIKKSASLYDGSQGPIIDLSQAVPGYPAHQNLINRLSEAAGDARFQGYGDIEGEAELRSAYARHMSDIYEVSLAKDEIHITAGCNQAFVAAVLSVAKAGDSILLVTPFYFNHDTSLSMLGITTKMVAASAENGFLPDPEIIAAAITPDIKAIACVTPNNPTGAIYPDALLNALFDLCQERGLWLILDETYRDFLAEETPLPHSLFHRANWREHLINLYSFSKSFCIPGHRLGAVTAGTDVIYALSKVMDNLQICAPCPPQHAVAWGLDHLSTWFLANRREIEGRRRAMEETVDNLTGWEIAAIGAYFCYIRHPFDDHTSVEAAEKLAATAGVITLPGSFFGEDQERYLRLAFANADQAEIGLLKDRLTFD